MSDSDDIYSSPAETHFQHTPSSHSIENTFRMAQVLQAKKDYSKAIDKFVLVCESIEKVIALNPGANVEIHWVIFSLGAIADIYQDRQDYNKSILFRNAQRGFLEYLQEQKSLGRAVALEVDDDDETDQDVITIASQSHSYMKLFEKVHEAVAEPEKPPPEDPKDLLRRLQEARKKDEEDKIEETIRLLNEAADQREKELKNSFWKRNLQRITDHPVMFVLVVLFVAFAIILYVKYKPKKKVVIPGGIDAQMAYLEKYVREYERKHGIKKDKGAGAKPKRPNLHDHFHNHDL